MFITARAEKLPRKLQYSDSLDNIIINLGLSYLFFRSPTSKNNMLENPLLWATCTWCIVKM